MSTTSPARRAASFIEVLVVGFIIVILASVLSAQFWLPGSKSGCIVSDKDRTTRISDGKSSARIYTDNCGVLEVRDNLLAGQLDSADVFGSIKVGKTYNFETRGIRFALTSAFPGIVGLEEVK